MRAANTAPGRWIKSLISWPRRAILIVCRRYSRAYLRHLMQAGEALSARLNTIHNLAYYLGIMRRVRAELDAQTAPVTPSLAR